MKKPFAWMSLLAVIPSLLVPSLGLAASDDHIIWSDDYTSAVVFNAQPNMLYVGLGGGMASISNASDTDYILYMCRGAKLKSVGISLNAASSDFDIVVYDTSGKQLGVSQTKSSNEKVDITAKQLTAVVVKVYGYMGSTGGYDLSITCA